MAKCRVGLALHRTDRIAVRTSSIPETPPRDRDLLGTGLFGVAGEYSGDIIMTPIVIPTILPPIEYAARPMPKLDHLNYEIAGKAG